MWYLCVICIWYVTTRWITYIVVLLLCHCKKPFTFTRYTCKLHILRQCRSVLIRNHSHTVDIQMSFTCIIVLLLCHYKESFTFTRYTCKLHILRRCRGVLIRNHTHTADIHMWFTYIVVLLLCYCKKSFTYAWYTYVNYIYCGDVAVF